MMASVDGRRDHAGRLAVFAGTHARPCVINIEAGVNAPADESKNEC